MSKMQSGRPSEGPQAMRRWVLWTVSLVVASIVALWWVWSQGWLDWFVAENGPTRRLFEASSWVAGILGFLVALVALAVSFLLSRRTGALDARSDDDADELILDKFAKATEKTSREEAAAGRLSVRLPVRWQVARRQVASRAEAALAAEGPAGFSPFPGLSKVVYDELAGGGGLGKLYKLYGGLASGRMVLVGPAGAGKTSAAFFLIWHALSQRRDAAREDRLRMPVPVMLMLRDWDPGTEPFTDWVARQLSQSYRLFRGRHGREQAKNLLAHGRIAVFLDGFDEVDHSVRPVVLSELNHATFRLVLLSRAFEAVVSRKRSPWRRALGLELKPVEPQDVVGYLLQGELNDPLPPPWQAVVNELSAKPDGRLAEALKYPLVVSLLPEAYGNNDAVDELLDAGRFPTVTSIRDRLLDQVVKAAFQTGRRSRHAETAEHTLRFIARRLKDDQTSDLAWWQIPTWMPDRLRVAALGFPVVITTAVTTTTFFGPCFGLGSALLLGIAAFTGSPKEAQNPLPTTGWRDIVHRQTATVGLLVGLANLLAVPVVFLINPGVVSAVYVAVSAVLAGFVAMFLTSPAREMVAGLPHAMLSEVIRESRREEAVVMRRTGISTTRVVGPREVWRHHAYARLGVGLVFGLATGVWFSLVLTTGGQEELAVPAGTLVAITFGIFSGVMTNLAFAIASTAVYLRLTAGFPLRLISFLEDARRRNVLRTSGQVYQFRHVTLRDRLAEHAEGSSP
jgi:hypothetical protein